LIADPGGDISSRRYGADGQVAERLKALPC